VTPPNPKLPPAGPQELGEKLKAALIESRLGQGSVGWNYDGHKLAAAVKTLIGEIDQAAAAPASETLTFDEWFAHDELTDGCRGTSQLERDQMRDSWNAALVYGRGRKDVDEAIITFSSDETAERARFAEWSGSAPVDDPTARNSDRDTFWCWQAWQAALGMSPSVRGPAFLTNVRLPDVKGHIIAMTVNKLRHIARTFHAHGSLRDRISYVLLPVLQEPIRVSVTTKTERERINSTSADA
jgi:hypothetical protein